MCDGGRYRFHREPRILPRSPFLWDRLQIHDTPHHAVRKPPSIRAYQEVPVGFRQRYRLQWRLFSSRLVVHFCRGHQLHRTLRTIPSNGAGALMPLFHYQDTCDPIFGAPRPCFLSQKGHYLMRLSPLRPTCSLPFPSAYDQSSK